MRIIRANLINCIWKIRSYLRTQQNFAVLLYLNHSLYLTYHFSVSFPCKINELEIIPSWNEVQMVKQIDLATI